PVAQGHHAAKKLAPAHCRVAEPLFARRHVGHHTASRPDDCALADRHIVREPNLSGQDDAILDDDAAGDAALRDDNAVATYPHIVSDLHQVVDLGAFANDSIAIGAAIDGGAGADFHVVLNDDATDLQHFTVTACSHHITESVLTNGAAGMNDHAIADQAIGDGSIGTDAAMAADTHVGSDRGAGVDHRAHSDFGARTDNCARVHGDAVFRARARMNERADRDA